MTLSVRDVTLISINLLTQGIWTAETFGYQGKTMDIRGCRSNRSSREQREPTRATGRIENLPQS